MARTLGVYLGKQKLVADSTIDCVYDFRWSRAVLQHFTGKSIRIHAVLV